MAKRHEHEHNGDVENYRIPDEPPASTPQAEPTPEAPAPTLSVLLPGSARIGDPSFALRVIGTRFDPTSVIVFAGQDEPTTKVSAGELTTVVDMTLWQGPDPAIPVLVRNDGDGTVSNTLLFAFEPALVPTPVADDPAAASRPAPYVHTIERVKA